MCLQRNYFNVEQLMKCSFHFNSIIAAVILYMDDISNLYDVSPHTVQGTVNTKNGLTLNLM